MHLGENQRRQCPIEPVLLQTKITCPNHELVLVSQYGGAGRLCVTLSNLRSSLQLLSSGGNAPFKTFPSNWSHSVLRTHNVSATIHHSRCPLSHILPSFLALPISLGSVPPMRFPWKSSTTGLAARWLSASGSEHEPHHTYPVDSCEIAERSETTHLVCFSAARGQLQNNQREEDQANKFLESG